MGEITLSGIKLLLDNQTADIKNSISAIKQNFREAENRLNKVEDKCLLLERKIRKNNIVIFNLDIGDENLILETIKSLNKLLALDFKLEDVNNIYKIKRESKSPIVIEFISFQKKLEIFQSKEKLRALKGTGIGIANDLCKEDRQENSVLRKHLKKAKEENKQARIKGHKIEIDSVWYTAKELELSDRDTDYNTEGEEEEENTGDEETSQNSRGERGTSLRNTEGNGGQVGTRSAQQEKKRKAVVSPPIVHKKKVHKKKKH